jgi:hypothetical protein
VPPNPADAQPRGIALLLAGALFVSGGAVAAVAGSTRPANLSAVSAAAPAGARAASSTSDRPGGSADSAGSPAGSALTANSAADRSVSMARAEIVHPLLFARAAAAIGGRRAAWLKPLLPVATGFRAAQATAFDGIRRLPVRSWTYRLVSSSRLTPARPALGSDAFVVQVVLAYRLAGDTRDVERRQYLTVARDGHGWALAGDSDGPTEKALWDIAPLTVESGRRSLVIGLGRGRAVSTRLHRTVLEADVAARQVDAVWGTQWPRTVVLVIPQTLQQMAEVLGRTAGGQQPGAGGLDQVAAVTSGELDRCCGVFGGVADRVVVNPVPFARLTPLGRHVVLAHELTHVATRASARVAPPLWVEEGFANYVGYRGSKLSATVIAADLVPLVRAGRAEQHLPPASAFDPAFGPIAPAYADSWLAFTLIAGKSPARAVSFYRVAAGLQAGPDSSERDLAAAFSSVLHTDQATFEANWRTRRAHVLAAG